VPVVVENEIRTPPLLVFAAREGVVVVMVVAQNKMKIPPLVFGAREGGGNISVMLWLYRGGGAYLAGALLHGPPGAVPLSYCHCVPPVIGCGPPIHQLQ
jgi:hypothetical protein